MRHGGSNLTRWVLGAVLAILLLLGGWWVTAQEREISQLRATVQELAQERIGSGEGIVTLEVQRLEMTRRLQILETKLDLLLNVVSKCPKGPS